MNEQHGAGSSNPCNEMLAESLRTLARGYSTETGRDTLLRAARIVASCPDETGAGPDEGFQARVYDWMAKCFMRPDSMLPVQRSFRFIEEALELVQASGTSREEVLRLVDYVYGRPAGVVAQEIGGVMVTLSGLATSFGLSMEYAGNAELDRCEVNTATIRAKDLAKPQRSPLPGPNELKASEGLQVGAPECVVKDCGQPRADGDPAMCADHRAFHNALNQQEHL